MTHRSLAPTQLFGCIPARPATRAFTLIELLIVVAIITILAAIAVPNFLEAQVRAKVSATKNDLRVVATALEAYYVDGNAYPPNDGLFNVIPRQLSTPIAFITDANMLDPFNLREFDPVYGDLIRYYTYTRIVTYAEHQRERALGHGAPIEGIDDPAYNRGAFAKYGKWRLVGFGPDRDYNIDAEIPQQPVVRGADTLYDPTNGTVSPGNLLRTQLSPAGIVVP